jgi:hypothetical protein
VVHFQVYVALHRVYRAVLLAAIAIKVHRCKIMIIVNQVSNTPE